MLSAMLGAPRRIRALGSGTEYSGSMRSELRIETTVRASTRVVFSARGAGAVLGGAGTTVADCCTTVCSGRAATTCGAATGFVAVASGAVAGAGAIGAAVVEAGAGDVAAPGEVETTTVEDFTRVVVQEPEVVVALDDGAGAEGVAEEEAAAVCRLAAGAGAAGAVVEVPALDDVVEPAGAAGDGEACFAAASVVSRGAEMVVSRLTGPAFDALRTLSIGRAGEADRAVAKRTCSIIAG
jgi:hypothetical protein